MVDVCKTLEQGGPDNGKQFKAAAIAATGEPRLDILVNNAGVAPAISLSQTSESAFDEVLTVNFKAPFFLIQAVADHIAEAMSVFSRVGQPADVADVIAFLASSEARWTTGQVIDATGGARP